MKRFSYKRISLLWLVLVTMLTGCQRQNHQDDRTSQSPTPTDSIHSSAQLDSEMKFMIEREIVLNQVKDVYRVIKSEYMKNGGVYETEFFDMAYCSKSWKKLLMSVRCKEEQTNTLFFEINPWSMSRFSGSIVSFEEFEVTRLILEPERQATVSFMVTDGDTFTPARVDLVYEDGRWVIDNFYNLRYMLDVRNCMWQFLAQDLTFM